MALTIYDELVAEIETTLGLPRGLIDQLQSEGDDWSFVIKAHAMLEAAFTHLLVSATGQPLAHDFFARIELSGEKTGKLALAKQLDLVPAPQRGFVRALSELRNALVHDVTNVSFSFESYLTSMSNEEKAAFTKRFSAVFEKNPTRLAEVRRDSPRRMIWSSLLVVLGVCYKGARGAELQRQIDALNKDAVRLAVTGMEVTQEIQEFLATRKKS